MSERRFQQNLERWARAHPKEAVMLPYVGCDHLFSCKTKQGEPNLRTKKQYYHSNIDAKKEAKEWLSHIDLDRVDLLYVYGVGLGYYYHAIKKWLKKNQDHHLVFLEDDLAVIHKLFETKMGTEILKDRQVSLYFFRTIDETDFIFRELFWNFIGSTFAVSALKYYAKAKKEVFLELQHHVAFDTAHKKSLLEEYLHYGIAFFKNFYRNLFQLPGSYSGHALFKKFNNVPAVICGAGPSLQKNRSLLKSIKGKALIFAGGSALRALSSESITPHLGAGIDPNPSQEERLKKLPLTLPFFYRNRIFPGALKCVKGPRLYLTGAGGYDVPKWFEQRLQIEGEEIEEGQNVVNFCLEIAHALGCNPIIFIGMDLAYTDMQAYSSGVIGDASVTKKTLEKKVGDSLLLKKDIFGREVYTSWQWISEAKWISDFAKKNPTITVINATEGGIGFPDVPNMPFMQVINAHLQRRFSLQARLRKEIEKGKILQVGHEDIVQAMEELCVGLERCILHLKTMLEDNREIREEKTSCITGLQTGKGILAETELMEEEAYLYVLRLFHAVISRVTQRDFKKLENFPETEKLYKSLDLYVKHYAFLIAVAKVNIELMRDAMHSVETEPPHG